MRHFLTGLSSSCGGDNSSCLTSAASSRAARLPPQGALMSRKRATQPRAHNLRKHGTSLWLQRRPRGLLALTDRLLTAYAHPANPPNVQERREAGSRSPHRHSSRMPRLARRRTSTHNIKYARGNPTPPLCSCFRLPEAYPTRCPALGLSLVLIPDRALSPPTSCAVIASL